VLRRNVMRNARYGLEWDCRGWNGFVFQGKKLSTVDRHAVAMPTPGDRAHGSKESAELTNGRHRNAQHLSKRASSNLFGIERNNAHAQVLRSLRPFCLPRLALGKPALAQAAISEPGLYAFGGRNRLNRTGMNKIVRSTSSTLCSFKSSNAHVQTCNRSVLSDSS
jgi:hypothetical protein